ncbi:MAG: type IV secretion system DNA-binding domain-containing protein [Pseudomonadota bacterium]
MQNEGKAIALFARTCGRPQTERVFGIKYRDRFAHMYVVGKTGTGKTTLLETLVAQDIHAGHGVTLIDPHGDYVDRLAAAIPTHRQRDFLYFNVPDPNQPYGYNPLTRVPAHLRPLVAAGQLEILKKAWADSWGQRLEHILRNALLALMEQREATLHDVLQLLSDRQYRNTVLANVSNERVKAFWTDEYAKYPPRLRSEAIVPIQNKVGAFLADPVMNRVLTSPDQPLRLRQIMDERKILLINLARGRIGEDAAHLIGGFMVTALGLAAYSRSSLPETDRNPHFLYVDEFQNFTTLSIANMISELRKYKVGLVLANQYLRQLEPQIRDAVLGNAGSLISFRLGGKDAPYLAREFEPAFSATDIISLDNFHIYLRLMIDGTPSRPFSATTITPSEAERLRS